MEVQVRVVTVVWSWRATSGRATTNTVKVMLTDSSPASTVHSTHHWYRSEPATRWCIRCRNSSGHGTTIPPSRPRAGAAEEVLGLAQLRGVERPVTRPGRAGPVGPGDHSAPELVHFGLQLRHRPPVVLLQGVGHRPGLEQPDLARPG